MSISINRVLTFDEFREMGDDAVSRGYYRNDRRIFLPGMIWPQPYIYDPSGVRKAAHLHVMLDEEAKKNNKFLSIHYWTDWSSIRPPLCVVCPNGEWWEIDRKSSNGTGWKVTIPNGDWTKITCTPSIVVDGYHGHLENGKFTADLDGRGPNGVPRPIV